jgi:hypothetical protein
MDGGEDEKWKVIASSDTSPEEAARKALPGATPVAYYHTHPLY